MIRWIKALDRILRGEVTRPDDLREGKIDVPFRGLSFVILVLGVIYGVCMGVFAVVTRWNSDHRRDGWLQIVSSAVKVPSLLFLTLLVTFPSLYVFNALVGSRLTFMQLLRLLIAAMGVMMAVLASFGTIVAFFSVSTESYTFMVLLNVVVFAASGFLSLGFLLQTLRRFTAAAFGGPARAGAVEPSEVPPADPFGHIPPPIPQGPPGPLDKVDGLHNDRAVKKVFAIWIIVFGLVGAQMSWVLRPFILHPHSRFVMLRGRESNFFTAVSTKIIELLGGDDRPRQPKPPAQRPAATRWQ